MPKHTLRTTALTLVVCAACAPDDGFVTGASITTMPSGSEADATAAADSSSTADASATDPSDATDEVDSGSADSSAGSEAESDDTAGSEGGEESGGLPEGVLATGELYPADLVRIGDEIVWANQMDGDCIRRVSTSGGAASDIACEPSASTLPLQVIAYGDGLAYSFMSTSGGGSLGFGGVRLVDPAGGAPVTIDEGSRFKSSSSTPFCNDTLAASGNHLFWYAHELSAYDSAIVHYDGSSVDAFMAESPFPYGVLTTPTRIYWSATEAYYAKELDGLFAAPTPIGTTQGSSCGRTAASETLYVASRGTFATGPALFRFSDGLFSNVRDLAEVAYDLAVDDTHLYLAYEAHVDRLPLADLGGAAPETIVEGFTVGGILRDADRLYWSDYYGGEVRYETL